MTQIGLRELRQNASHWVERAAAGETIEITNRGTPVAVLRPPSSGSLLEQHVARGEIARATRRLEDVEPLPAQPGTSLSRIVVAMREDECY